MRVHVLAAVASLGLCLLVFPSVAATLAPTPVGALVQEKPADPAGAAGDSNVEDDAGGGDATSVPLSKPAEAKGVFDGAWNITTERGDSFRLLVKDDGKKVTGTVTFKNGSKLTFTGRGLETGGASLVWQLGSIVGTGDLNLASDGKKLSGKLILADGGDLAGGTWDGTRVPAAAAAALPLGDGAPADAGSSSAGSGFIESIVVSTVSVRDKPSSKKSTVVATLQRGTKIAVKCADNGWCELDDGSGYVAKSFVKVGSTSLVGTGSVPAKKATPAKKVVKKDQKPKPQKDQPPAAGFAIGGFGIPIIRLGN